MATAAGGRGVPASANPLLNPNSTLSGKRVLHLSAVARGRRY